MTIPPLSDEQRQQARNAATEARRRRADIKQALRTGTSTLTEVLALAEGDEVVAHAKVVDVLKSLPRVGAVRASKVMERLDIAANRRLRGLGKHQTAALIVEFGPRSGTSGSEAAQTSEKRGSETSENQGSETSKNEVSETSGKQAPKTSAAKRSKTPQNKGSKTSARRQS